MVENLDAMKCGGWGVFIAPTTKMTVGEGFCRMAHRTPDTVRCTSHVTRPLDSDHWSSDMWGHRTVTVHYPVRLLAPALTLRAQSRTVHCSYSFYRRPMMQLAVAPLAHQTVQCYTGQSGEL
jgi:hypothetical protein